MSTRPNEAQEMYASSDYTPDDVQFFDENGISYSKAERKKRRRGTAMAKRRFFRTAQVVSNNLRARIAEEEANPYSVNKSYAYVALDVIKTAKKMGMDI